MTRRATRKDRDDMNETEVWHQCPHEVIRATCAGGCNCPCDPCAPSRPPTVVVPGGASQEETP